MIDHVLLHLVRHLRSQLPSRADSPGMFLSRSARFVGVGVSIWLLVSWAMPGAFMFPKYWLLSLGALTNWFQIAVYFILTVVMMWSACYSIGMLALLILRGSFRIWLGRRIATHSQK